MWIETSYTQMLYNENEYLKKQVKVMQERIDSLSEWIVEKEYQIKQMEECIDKQNECIAKAYMRNLTWAPMNEDGRPKLDYPRRWVNYD